MERAPDPSVTSSARLNIRSFHAMSKRASRMALAACCCVLALHFRARRIGTVALHGLGVRASGPPTLAWCAGRESLIDDLASSMSRPDANTTLTHRSSSPRRAPVPPVDTKGGRIGRLGAVPARSTTPPFHQLRHGVYYTVDGAQVSTRTEPRDTACIPVAPRAIAGQEVAILCMWLSVG